MSNPAVNSNSHSRKPYAVPDKALSQGLPLARGRAELSLVLTSPFYLAAYFLRKRAR